MTPEQIQKMIDDAMSAATQKAKAELTVHIKSLLNPRSSIIKSAFDENYYLLNTTNARSTNPPPRGSILMVDAGTTPTRVIALYLSTGGSLVEIFAKVI